ELGCYGLQAVSCDDFLAAMADANGADLGSFNLWYSQAGTPELHIDASYDAAAKTYTLKCTQKVPATPGQPTKAPMVLPLAVGLLGAQGGDLDLTLEGASKGTTCVLRMTESQQNFVFTDSAVTCPSPAVRVLEAPAAASLLRNFSAPVKLTTNQV
ncbi:hypothetical protein CYMTET_33917, partial [Cymbomonas tetramitiformis]